MPKSLFLSVLLACSTLSTPVAWADDLADGFNSPPQSARPRVWWHWMNGNVTKDGIEKDLDWMARMGIGGVQNFDANLMTPQIVSERLTYMTDGWKDAFRHAVMTAEAKGLEFAIAASPGWSETGGPWVEAHDGMKKLVWAETTLLGGQRFNGRLPAPPAVIGAFQSAKTHELDDGFLAKRQAITPLYRDARILAYPIPSTAPLPLPTATQADGKPVAISALIDSDLESTVALSVGSETQPDRLTLDYGKPVTVQAATLFVPHAKPPFRDPLYQPVLEFERDGQWHRLGDFSLGEASTTIAFNAVTARRFRLTLSLNTGPTSPPLEDGAPGAIKIDIFAQDKKPTLAIGDFRLHGEAKIDRFEAKAGYTILPDYSALEPAGHGEAIETGRVIDLTDKLNSDGTLNWTAPKGDNWRILRMGWSLTGKTNHPATPEATGLEVDKYDAAAVRRYLETYLGLYRDTVGPDWIGKKGIRALLTDSIEVGAANWTPRMIEEFTERRGYDPVPFLPTLTGAIIGSRARSDAFLYDFRQTLADLMAEAHYGTIAKVAHEQGLVVYGEALENGRPVLGDDLAMRAHADVPMAALWTFGRGGSPRPTLIGDMKGAASVAHIYGQNIVSAESMTSAFAPWAFAPSDLKRIIDLEFASGVNRPVIHTSVHQPVDDKVPGLSLMIFGQYFNRHESWAEMAKPWVDYMARTSYLLQQGRDSADVAYFYGEDQPITSLFEHDIPGDLPVRYAYDFVNADILSKQLTVENGDLVAKSGARYRALYLGPASKIMTLSTLRRIATLVDEGATVIGMAPLRAPGLLDDAAAFKALRDRLWGGTVKAKGRVIATTDVEAALADIGVGPDFHITAGATNTNYRFVHRKLDDGDLYFVNNRTADAGRIEARFRVTGKQPEIWRAIDGSAKPVTYRIEGSETVIPLDVEAEDAFFVLFRQSAPRDALDLPVKAYRRVVTLDGPWTVDFQSGRGAPDRISMTTLTPLEAHADKRIKYFSGIATYRSDFSLPPNPRSRAPLWVDLGKIGDVAEVRVNGQLATTLWFPPYRVDVSNFVKTGKNHLEVRVANLWVNRLIGDQQPDAEKISFTAAPTYQPDAPLRPSGLLGPVTILATD